MAKKKRGGNETALFRRRAISYLLDRGVKFDNCPSSNLLVSLLLADSGLPEPLKALLASGKKQRHIAFINFFDLLPKAQRPRMKTYGGNPLRKAPQPIPLDAAFYETDEWKRLRYRVLQHYGARCMCCGATPKDGVKMHVDHIKPKSKYPELALEFSNMQVLCDPCNMGKSNIYDTDWRDLAAE